MSLLNNYTTALRSEYIKKKGTGTYWLCFSFGVIIPLIYLVAMFFLWEENQEPVNIPINFYEKNIGQALSLFLGFFFPLLIIIMAAKITQIDHKNGGWQLMETQPLSKLSIYMSKLTVLLVGNLIAIISFLGSFVVVLWILSLIKEVPQNVMTAIPFSYLGQLAVRMFVAGLFLSMIQFVISVVFRSFILPILLGFFVMLGSLILEGLKIYRMWNPFTILNHTASYPKGSQLDYFLLYTEKISMVGFLMTAIIGFIWYQNKTFKRTFTKPKNLSKVLGVALVGILGISFLYSPNTYEKHNRTVIAGNIESDESVQKGYVIDKFINDTIVEIDIQDNKFHAVIKNEVPLERYYVVFKASNQFYTELYIGTNDSINMDIQYYKSNSNFKTTKGTRLAENQYTPGGMFGGWSYSGYLIYDNSYLNRPEKVINEIYKEWKEKLSDSDKYRTPDNYAPQADFIERNKKVLTLEYLNMWNIFEEKLKVVNPDIVNNTPKKIQEIKDYISLEDNSLITDESYFRHIMYEYTKKDTTDTDQITKRLSAISKLENKDFKDRLLFSSLKSSLKSASDSQERQELIKTYGEEISNPKLKSLAYNHFTTQEKLAKGNPAQDFVAQNLDGEDVRLSDFKGKFVVIDVWATWCGPCRVESPHFERIAIKNKNNPDIVFMAISVDQKKDDWYFQAKTKSESVLQLHLAGAEENAFSKAYDVEFIPRFIFIDKEGNFVNSKMINPSQNYFETIISDELKKEE
ncbi:MAG: redoxin family protein [Flavobacteriaceae bacterium]